MGGSSANRLTGQSGGVNGDNLGAAGGGETHTLTTAQLASHSHTLSGGLTTSASGGSSGATGLLIGTRTIHDPPVGDANITTGDTNFDNFSIANQGSGSAHNNVQPTIILNYIIKT